MELQKRTEALMGSEIEITLPSESAGLFDACFGEFRRIENAYSRFKPASELSKLNSSLHVWHNVDEEMIRLLKYATNFHEKTDGNFDITLKAALDKLGYGNARHESSDDPDLEPEIPIFIDERNKRILLHKQVDFGGFGKGYASDKAAQLLEKSGVKHYCINAGGDVFARYSEGEPWSILLEHPDDPERAIGFIQLDGNAVAGSAPNRRKWGDGKHHLLNASSKLPAQGVKAIFVLAKTCMEADAYATGLFTAGFEEGIALSKKLPVEIMVISAGNKMFTSPGFNATLFT